jgi:hypothetical protein
MGIGLYPWSFFLRLFVFRDIYINPSECLTASLDWGYLADLLQLKRALLISGTLDERNTALEPVGALMPHIDLVKYIKDIYSIMVNQSL